MNDAPSPDPASAQGDDPLLAAVRAVLSPLAQLAVSQGLSYATMDELLKQALVQAARRSLLDGGVNSARMVSRISTSTGIHRKEVTRLTSAQHDMPGKARGGRSASLASQVFAQWVSDPRWHDPGTGQPGPLRRQGPAPSFEALARTVTQDVHPRSVLDELCRLGVAALDEASDTAMLLKHAFVPGGDQQHLLGFLGDNVGDHLQGAVQNVLGQIQDQMRDHEPRQHFDQAVFCEGLSDESLAAVRQFVKAQWTALLAQAVPLLEARIAHDKQAAAQDPGHAAHKRLRIGLYTFDTERITDTAAPAATPPSQGEQTS